MVENFTRARAAAGVLFFDEQDRILLVEPSYKDHLDIPGGYVEKGETPRQAAAREVAEELGIHPPIGRLLVTDWAPTTPEGDKILFIFDAGMLGTDDEQRITLPDGELTEWRFVAVDDLDPYGPARLTRRIRTAVTARDQGQPTYAEHGSAPA